MSRYMVRYAPINLWACIQNWNNVMLLMHADGTNGSTDIKDISSQRHAITLSGGVALSTAQAKFGSSSTYFDGVDDCVILPQEYGATWDDWNTGTTDFTYEFWFRPTQINSTYQTLWARQSSAGVSNHLFQIRISNTNKLEAIFTGNGSSTVRTMTGTTTVSQDAWHHAAFVRNGGTFKLYLNGAEEATLTEAVDFTNTGMKMCLGALALEGGAIAQFYKGYIDEIRYSRGLARYTAAFSPPTEAFPDDTTNPLNSYIATLDPDIFFKYNMRMNAGSPETYWNGNTYVGNFGKDTQRGQIYGGGTETAAQVVTDCGYSARNVGGTTTSYYPLGRYTVTGSTSYWTASAITASLTFLTLSTFSTTGDDVYFWHHGSHGVSDNQGLAFTYNGASGVLGASWFNAGWRSATIATLSGGNKLQPSTKYHIAFVYCRTGGSGGLGYFKVYINGSLTGSVDITSAAVLSNSQMATFGTGKLDDNISQSYHMKANVDNALYFAKELNSTEIGQLASLSLT